MSISTPTSPDSSLLDSPTSPWRTRRFYRRPQIDLFTTASPSPTNIEQFYQFSSDADGGDDTVSPQSITSTTGGGNGTSLLDSEYEYPIVYERVTEPRNHRCRNEKRVIEKIGCDNVISIKNISRMKSVRYLKDIVNTIIDSRWRWTLWIFILTYFANWIVFGSLWMLLPNKKHENIYNSKNNTYVQYERDCFIGTETFTAYFLLAVETQTTIGFGNRNVTHYCFDAILILCLQMLTSILINGAFLGAVYAKMIRPIKYSRTRIFSKYAVISQRDGKLCFMFRVWDINHSHIIGTKIQAYFIRTHKTQENELLKNYMIDMKIESHGLLIWPLTIVHIIDENSPLYDMSAKDLLTKRFEIIVVLTGCSESTSQTSQMRTSYLSNEILWGHRLIQCTEYDNRKQAFIIDHRKFHRTLPINTPLCSAKYLNNFINTLK
ncbi:inward rectifier potassium channel 2-like, partial [Chrysoperla carnea]|uniref:inward rectifier potassium channel 2-like n=1 Tax=Chrysoperla carnea TaxID=189513 RepID=UPI001D067412